MKHNDERVMETLPETKTDHFGNNKKKNMTENVLTIIAAQFKSGDAQGQSSSETPIQLDGYKDSSV